MSAVVFDTSAVIALLRGEPGADLVAHYVGQAAMPAVNLQELVKALHLRGWDPPVIETLVQNLRLDIPAHDREAAFGRVVDGRDAAVRERDRRSNLYGTRGEASFAGAHD